MKSKGSTAGRWASEFSDLLIFILLIVASIVLLHSHDIKSEDASATLVGAMLGAAVLLLGNWINRWNERRRASNELEDRRSKIKVLVAAELVNVTSGLIGARATVNGFVMAAQTGAELPPLELLPGDAPRPMSFTDGIGAEILILDHKDIDVLTTLRSNLAITRLSMDEVAAGRRVFGQLTAMQLDAAIRHDFKLLAEAFERFAPERKFALPGKVAEFATKILRQMASENSP